MSKSNDDLHLTNITIQVAGFLNQDQVAGLEQAISVYLNEHCSPVKKVDDVGDILASALRNLETRSVLLNMWELRGQDLTNAIERCLDVNPWIDNEQTLSDLVKTGAHFDLSTGKLIALD